MAFVVRGRFVNSGCAVLSGSTDLGSTGTTLTGLLFGSACINAPSATACATVVSASLTVANVANGDNLFVQPHHNAPSGMVLKSACAIAGGISASWYNSSSGAQSSSADVVVSYLVLKP